jgi:hypothetical protein
MVAQVRYSVAGRSRGQVTLCAVCTVHEETRSTSFWLRLKTKVDSLSKVWPQNHWDGLLVVWPQIHCHGLSVVWPQNHWDGFLQFGLKTGGDCFLWVCP